MIKKVKLSAAEWRQRLSPEVYAITRAAETEPPFSGEYWDQHNKGIYHCACCRLELFHSRDKYDSGTGWPSFNQPIVATNINNRADHSRFHLAQKLSAPVVMPTWGMFFRNRHKRPVSVIV